VLRAIERAYEVLETQRTATVCKTIWGSPAGKKRIAERLVAMLPTHKTYVEPFAGSAAVLFAKERSEVEVINDADTEIARAYKLVQKLKAKDIARLREKKWVGDEATFKSLIDENPRDDVGWLHRFLYLTHFSYGKMRSKSFSPSVSGVEAKTVDRIEQFAPRLRGVKIYGGDYRRIVEKYDGKDTVHFLDPPYAGYNVDVGEDAFDEAAFCELLCKLDGKFLVTYGIRGELPKLVKEAGFEIRRIRTRRSIGSMRGVGGPSILTQLLISNYTIARKSLDGLRDDGWDIEEPAAVSSYSDVGIAHESSPEPGQSGDDAPTSELEKAQPFGTFGGSFHYAKRLLPLIPEHKVYVEPFAGAAALLHAKEPSENEVIADVDADVVFLHRAIKSMTAERVAELAERFPWEVTEETFAKARDLEPKDDLARFYKLVFVRTHARDCRPDGTHPARQHLGSTTNPGKYLKAAERLRDVTILRQDYRKTIEKLDGPDTFFFIDPPYPGEWFDKDAVIDLDEFTGVLKGIKGKFIAVLNNSPENVAAFKKVGYVFKLKVREASGRGGAKQAMRLFCANYGVRKSEEFELVAKCEGQPFSRTCALLKGTDPGDERFVLGIVLEPEVVDAQGDIYSADEIRQAAHRFMEEFGGLGLMHRMRVNGQVKVLESFLAPIDFDLAGVAVRKGTWLLGVHVISDELWGQVKDGTLTGFSIGGSARRHPEPSKPASVPDSTAADSAAQEVPA
jgi:site-specific DNA-adenine methylase